MARYFSTGRDRSVDAVVSREAPGRTVRVRFCARDLPEPAGRARAARAVVHVSATKIVRRAGERLNWSYVSEVSEDGEPSLRKRRSAPPFDNVEVEEVTKDGEDVAWIKVGATEVARKSGRDVEFARAFDVVYVPGAGQTLRIVFYDCARKGTEKERVVGVAEVRLSQPIAARGREMPVPLRFVPITVKEKNKSIADGELVLAVEELPVVPPLCVIDIQCEQIQRAKAMSSSCVQKAFYTVHAVLDPDPKSDHWTLVYRSESVEMVHRKRDGGSLEYNYFSSRPVIAGPGLIIAKESENSPGKAGLLQRVGQVLGKSSKVLFFSMPSAELRCTKDSQRLKLSLFEDNGHLSGFDLIADTQFTIADLKSREIGSGSPISIHNTTVGAATLRFIERSPNPNYFCLSLSFSSNLR